MTDSVHPVRAFRRGKTPPMALETLAAAVGVTKASLSRIETGKQSMTPALARKLAKETGISPRVLCPELAELMGREAAE